RHKRPGRPERFAQPTALEPGPMAAPAPIRLRPLVRETSTKDRPQRREPAARIRVRRMGKETSTTDRTRRREPAARIPPRPMRKATSAIDRTRPRQPAAAQPAVEPQVASRARLRAVMSESD